ncbi:MAG: DUF1294 domain-containing protein [Pseudomonadota bacterium]
MSAPLWVAGVYLAASAIAFVMYAIDKSAARRRAWRVSERTLHFWALAGGWPGALLAQRMLRHKSSKARFRGVFWGTVVLNVVGIAVLWVVI